MKTRALLRSGRRSREQKNLDTPTPRGNLHRAQNKRVVGKAIRKTMKTKGEQSGFAAEARSPKRSLARRKHAGGPAHRPGGLSEGRVSRETAGATRAAVQAGGQQSQLILRRAKGQRNCTRGQKVVPVLLWGKNRSKVKDARAFNFRSMNSGRRFQVKRLGWAGCCKI